MFNAIAPMLQSAASAATPVIGKAVEEGAKEGVKFLATAVVAIGGIALVAGAFRLGAMAAGAAYDGVAYAATTAYDATAKAGSAVSEAVGDAIDSAREAVGNTIGDAVADAAEVMTKTAENKPVIDGEAEEVVIRTKSAKA